MLLPCTPGSDAYFLGEALREAERGVGWTSPNPPVGCVLVRDGEVIARGYHARDGGRHAEHEALHACDDPRGATAYITLEPCSVDTRTPSCCHLLAASGIRQVVYGAADADPRNAARAVAILAEQGIPARLPQDEGAEAIAAECRRFIDGYTYAQRAQQPFIHLKLALSLDAKLATATGSSQWLSGPESLGYAHWLRQQHDAILVGYRTVLVDDPRLTVRPEVMAPYKELAAAPRNPMRIVLDPHWEVLGRLTDGAHGGTLAVADFGGAFREHLPKLVVVGSKDEAWERRPEIEGLEVIGLSTVVGTAHARPAPPARSPGARGAYEWHELRAALWQLGVRSVLVEGGGGVAASLLAQCAVDKLTCVYTPRLLGSDSLGFSPPLALQEVSDGMELAEPLAQTLGNDVLLSGYPEWPAPL